MFSQSLIVLVLSSLFVAIHAAPLPMPSAIALGEYRNVNPKKAKNQSDPKVNLGSSSLPHPGIIVGHPDDKGRQKVVVITHGIGKHPNVPIRDVHPETTLSGYASLGKEHNFEQEYLQRPQAGDKKTGGPPPTPLTLPQVAHLKLRLAHVAKGGDGKIGPAPLATVNHPSPSTSGSHTHPAHERKPSTDSHHSSGSHSSKSDGHHVGGSHHGGSHGGSQQGSAPHSPVHKSPSHSPAHNSPAHSPHHHS